MELHHSNPGFLRTFPVTIRSLSSLPQFQSCQCVMTSVLPLSSPSEVSFHNYLSPGEGPFVSLFPSSQAFQRGQPTTSLMASCRRGPFTSVGNWTRPLPCQSQHALLCRRCFRCALAVLGIYLPSYNYSYTLPSPWFWRLVFSSVITYDLQWELEYEQQSTISIVLSRCRCA